MNPLNAYALGLVSLSATQAQAEISERAMEQALQRGDSLRSTRQCEEAIDVWRVALNRSGHWIFLERIGDCYRILGRNAIALYYLQRVLDEADSEEFLREWSPAIQEHIQQLRGELPTTLEVASNAGAASLYIDDAPHGILPMNTPLPIAPGIHSIRLERSGFESQTIEVDARRGQRNVAVLQLVSIRQVEPEQGPAQTQASVQRMSRLWSLLFFGAGSILSGLGGWLLAIDERRDYNTSYDVYLGDTPGTLAAGVGLFSLGVSLVIGGSVFLLRPPTLLREPH